MPDEFDPWQGSSGLLDDYNGTIIDAWFAKDAQYSNDPPLMLFLKVATDSPDEPEIETRFTCGPDWDSFDGGDTAEHPKRPMFNNNTQIMQFVMAAFACPPSDGGYQMDFGGKVGVKAITDAEYYLRQKGRETNDAAGNPLGPRSSKVWVGTSWHWDVKTETRKFKDRNTNEEVERTTSRPFPNQFLGVVDLGIGQPQGNEFANQPSQAPQPVATPSPTSAPQPTSAVPPSPAPLAPAPQPQGQTQPVEQPQQTAPAPTAPPAPTAAPTPQPTSAPPAPQPSTAEATQQPDTLLPQIQILAKSHPYAEWVDLVIALPGVASDANIVAALGSEDWYNQLRA